MNLKQMEYFTTIVREGSISGAARVLHISQPPLSAQMRLLEEELQASLFERGARSIQLTEAGRLFFERAQSILDMADAAKKDLEQLGQGLLGTLRLGMISSVETQGIIASIAAFRRQYPKAAFRIYEGNTYQLLDKLSTGQIEAAIVRTPFPEESYDCRYLAREPMMAVGYAEFFTGLPEERITLPQLAEKPLIIYRRWESVLERLFSHSRPDYLCVNDDARTSLMWAAAGAGVAILPASIMEGYPAGGLVVKTISHTAFFSTITLVKQKNASLSPLGQHFYQYLSV